MRKLVAAETPGAYVAALDGWRRRYTEALQSAVLAAAPLREAIKWGHLVYFSNGPVLLIRAEEERILFGFWRGQRLRKIEPRLRAGGKHEMATLEILESTPLEHSVVLQLVHSAVAFNLSHGDPTDLRMQGTSQAIRMSCPACGFRVFNRRYPRCERCGSELPASLLYSDEERRAILEGEQERLSLELTRLRQASRRQRTSGASRSSVPAPTTTWDSGAGATTSTSDSFASGGGGVFDGGGASGSFGGDSGPSSSSD